MIVAGGRDPKLLQINTTDLDTDNGSFGFINSTFVGSTRKITSFVSNVCNNDTKSSDNALLLHYRNVFHDLSFM